MASNDSLHQFGAYKKACVLFDLVVVDVTLLAANPVCSRLVSQQVASADSIASNIEEGYGRGGRKDYAHFLIIARGSATETRGRYEQRLKHWLPANIVAARVLPCEEIIAILSTTIRRLRSDP
ncbi:MAG TPA: four helix bundle protein [Opitutaceae bacterium]|nr:four helix bundle protein [Opitutaceae bacterium]